MPRARPKVWLVAAVAIWALAAPAAGEDPKQACDIDLGRLLSVAGGGDSDPGMRNAVRWRGDLPPWPGLRHTRHALTGRLEADLQVAGWPAAPRIFGEARLADGVYEHATAGTLIEDLTIAFRGTGSNVVGWSMSGADGTTGRISGRGSIAVGPAGGLTIEGIADLASVTVLRRDDVAAVASGTLIYRGTPCRGRIEGRLQAASVDARLTEPLPSSVVGFEVVEIMADGDEAVPPDRRAPEEGWRVDLDVETDLTGGVVVRGRGIESEWSGHLIVAGTLAEPDLRGVLSLVRGQISFAGRVFVMREGTLVFERGGGSSPLVDIVAIHEGKDIVALIKVAGAASAPLITLTSRPELPAEEILARILYGRSVSHLLPHQVVGLATAVRSLSRGETVPEQNLGLARTLIGIDILAEERRRRLRGDGDRRTGGIGPADEVPAQKPVEIEVAPGISVAAEQEEDDRTTEGSLGVVWKWDY